MSNRSWFFASQGTQQGPYPEARLRKFIANGTLTAETLVWSEGMAGWQKAGDVPGLLTGASGPPSIAQAGGPPVIAGGYGAAALTGVQWLNNLMSIVQFALYWLLIKWLVANLAPGGQPLGFSFSGSFWAYLGWNILVFLAIITIIGWAWVEVAQLRWLCRNIQGTRREVVFTGTGLEFLWRSIVAVLACLFIIPIPWMYRWMMRWLASQT